MGPRPMATRFCSPINFEEECTASGLACTTISFAQDASTTKVLVSRDVVRMASEFIGFKFGKVPQGDAAFVWDRKGVEGIRVRDEDVAEDASRFFNLMRLYEHRHCGT